MLFRSDVVADQNMWNNGYLSTLNHPEWGEVTMPGAPIRMSDTPMVPGQFVAELGQDTEIILSELGYSWDERAGSAKISVKQTQKISEETHLFDLPLTLRFRTKTETVERTIRIREKEEDFHFQLPSAPELVRVDPNTSILAKIQFKPTRPMLAIQLADHEDNIGQLIALEQLAEKPDTDAINLIQKALLNAKHHAVRMKAADTLKKAGTPEAYAALKSALRSEEHTSELQSH